MLVDQVPRSTREMGRPQRDARTGSLESFACGTWPIPVHVTLEEVVIDVPNEYQGVVMEVKGICVLSSLVNTFGAGFC